MKRALLLFPLALSACLDPGNPVYLKKDTTAPRILSVTPALFAPDAGTLTLQAGQAIDLTFSEEMDPTSLRPGIAIRKTQSKEELPLNIQAPALLTDNENDSDLAWSVKISAGQGTFQSGIHSLTVRTLLIDLQGNPLAAEQTGFFNVP